MSTNENLTQSDEIPSEQAITIQPSGIDGLSGIGRLDAGRRQRAGAGGVQAALAVLHAVRRHWLVILSTGLACAAVAGTAPLVRAQAEVQGRGHLGVGYLPHPTILGKPTADQAQQVHE